MADRLVNLTPLIQSFGAEEGVSATLTVRLEKAHVPVVRVRDEEAIFPGEGVRKWDGNAWDEPLSLTYDVPADSYWHIWLVVDSAKSKRPRLDRYVLVPVGTGSVDFEDLIDVDPQSGILDETGLDQFQAALRQVLDARNQVLSALGANGIGIAISFPALSTWSTPHGFARLPSVSLYDGNGRSFEADVYASATSVSVNLPYPISGTMVLN